MAVSLTKRTCFPLQELLKQSQEVLENADTPEVLMSIVDIILYTAKFFPHEFPSYFRVSSAVFQGSDFFPQSV